MGTTMATNEAKTSSSRADHEQRIHDFHVGALRRSASRLSVWGKTAWVGCGDHAVVYRVNGRTDLLVSVSSVTARGVRLWLPRDNGRCNRDERNGDVWLGKTTCSKIHGWEEPVVQLWSDHLEIEGAYTRPQARW